MTKISLFPDFKSITITFLKIYEKDFFKRNVCKTTKLMSKEK